MYIINLLLKKWYEPSSKQRYHFSTLVQQTLSVIGQYGGVRVDQLWKLLCETGPFGRVVKRSAKLSYKSRKIILFSTLSISK
ncbi:hypothetical protein N5U59_08590 [Aliarcobacter butzleri]|nr:hypothetical protein [Aliarcobacter butzleri]